MNQKIISQSNMSINSQIKESIIQNSHLYYVSESLLEFALEYQAFKIAKFLIMNDVKYSNGLYYASICSRNYEIIHHIESKIPENFHDYMIKFAISSWNNDLIQ